VTDFWERVRPAVASAAAVLDVGSGRRPAVPPTARPKGAHYVGLDISAHELALAPPGSYDETVVANAAQLVPELVGRFDLIISYGVLEHIRDLPPAVRNFHAYLKPPGTFLAWLSGKNAVFAIVNRLVPDSFGRRLVARLMRRELNTVFTAYYDHCDSKGLHAAFSGWDEIEIIPLWRGAGYFERFPGLLGLYLRYEDFAIARGWNRLASHYVVEARRTGERELVVGRPAVADVNAQDAPALERR
jgi:2-polyprenyl-6-hydroxyphenyl methylase/3-demethylubiquinone-9 3-methyltransferase